MQGKASIFVVDDDESTRITLGLILGREGFAVDSAGTAQEAIAKARNRFYNAALLDMKLPDMQGVELMAVLKELHPDMAIIVATAFASVETAVAALNQGASAYITKPLNLEELLHVIREALDKQRLQFEVRRLYQEVQQELAERRRAQEALRRSEERFRALIESTSDWIWETDASHAYTYASPKIKDLLGYEPDEVLGKTSLDLMEPEGTARVGALIDAMTEAREPIQRLENRFLHKDGRVVVLETSGIPIVDEDGELLGYRGIDRDITERKQLEEQLLQAEKLEAVGQLAGGVAHDLNNRLTVINGFSDFLLMSLEQESPLRGDVLEIRAAGERAARLVRQLLAYSRRQIVEEAVLDLNSIARDAPGLVRGLIGERVTIVPDLADHLEPIRADRAQVEEILTNLVKNASDAICEKPSQTGVVTIRTANVDLSESTSARRLGLDPGHYVCLSVNDTGVGMTADIKAHLFEPFFTTKGPDRGTGMGLASVYGIVKQARGGIDYQSEEGQGATFYAYFPIAGQPVVTLVPLVDSAQVPRGDETILVIEDQMQVRRVTAALLQNLGYRVLQSANGIEALQVLGRRARTIHMVVTDVVMPGMSGREFVAQGRRLCPDLRVLYMSGYSAEAMSEHGMSEPGIQLIQKPFSMAGLAQRVRDLLDENRP